MDDVGGAELNKHCKAEYGKRWPLLKKAMCQPVTHIAWINPFNTNVVLSSTTTATTTTATTATATTSLSTIDSTLEALSIHTLSPTALKTHSINQMFPGGEYISLSHCCLWFAQSSLVSTPPFRVLPSSLFSHYLLDGGSLLPALCVAPQSGHRVLDMCAAPGGKSLVLAGQLFYQEEVSLEKEQEGEEEETKMLRQNSTKNKQRSVLVCNDKNTARRNRLRHVLHDYLPSKYTKEQVIVSGVDGEAWGKGGGTNTGGWLGRFDRILLDAPCTHERHVLHGSGGWSKAKVRTAVQTQQQLIRAAIRVLNPRGGRLVYSTCALVSEENDGVVQKLLQHKRYGVGLRVCDPLQELSSIPGLSPLLRGVERTKLGAMVLPDSSDYGPLYWCVLEKGHALATSEDEEDDEGENDSDDEE